MKIYVYGYFNRVQSSRRLEREAQRNVELMWLTGRLAPDFKTIADFRRNSGKAIQKVCREFVLICWNLELFTDALVVIDGSKFKAVNNRDRKFTQAKMKRRLQDGDLIDVLVQKRKDKRAAKRFFRNILRRQCGTPTRITTDKSRSYSAAKDEVMLSVIHRQGRYANNRAEVLRQPTRQHERQMRRFKSLKQAQRFLSVHGSVNNLFRLGRHLLRACHFRMFRAKAFSEWQQVKCAYSI